MSAPSPLPTSANTLMTTSEIAVTLHVSLCTVRRLIASNELEAVRIGRSVRVQDSVLQAFIAKGARR